MRTKSLTVQFHNESMDYAESAMLAKMHGNIEEAERLFRKALHLELKALYTFKEYLLEHKEPTYSVLRRSAATLALDCNQPELAKGLIAEALLYGKPPTEIAQELQDLLEQINIKNRLSLHGYA
ncbi:MAG: hypothetical protein L3V56_11305 [Candidatus Magnetoovum sp. WYHC-5]|nr:hypothetical protein [Candidatus Magnetoovum sp. WYHC-5]